MKHCKDCKWWGDEDEEFISLPCDKHRPCSNPKVGGGSYADNDRMQDYSLNSYETVGVGSMFGCIHFEDK